MKITRHFAEKMAKSMIGLPVGFDGDKTAGHVSEAHVSADGTAIIGTVVVSSEKLNEKLRSGLPLSSISRVVREFLELSDGDQYNGFSGVDQ